MTQATNRESLSLGSFLFVACTAPSTMRIYAWPSFPLSTSTKIRINSWSAYGWKTQSWQNYIHPMLHRGTPQNYEAHEAANTGVCWIYLNYWSCWRHLGRETVVTQAKIWQNDRCQLCWVSQSTREHSVTNDQAHSFATAVKIWWEWSSSTSLWQDYHECWMSKCQKLPFGFERASTTQKTSTKFGYEHCGSRSCRASNTDLLGSACSIHAGQNTDQVQPLNEYISVLEKSFYFSSLKRGKVLRNKDIFSLNPACL